MGRFPGEEDSQLIPSEASHDCIAQCWFRFLHCLGNPVSLCRPAVISQTPKFLQFAITSETVIDPCQHPCLTSLPQIFLKAIKGIAGQVDAFLGKFCLIFLLHSPFGVLVTGDHNQSTFILMGGLIPNFSKSL